MDSAADYRNFEEPGEGFDAIAAAAKMLDMSEGILTITGACANVRSSMRDEQGWSEEFAEEFSQDLARALVTQALSPRRALEDLILGGES
nr:MAG TPA: hypothetical protein [Caudoviricetes sp.]